jgi:hypothetical protein
MPLVHRFVGLGFTGGDFSLPVGAPSAPLVATTSLQHIASPGAAVAMFRPGVQAALAATVQPAGCGGGDFSSYPPGCGSGGTCDWPTYCAAHADAAAPGGILDPARGLRTPTTGSNGDGSAAIDHAKRVVDDVLGTGTSTDGGATTAIAQPAPPVEKHDFAYYAKKTAPWAFGALLLGGVAWWALRR